MFVGLSLLFFPARAGFHFHPRPCDCTLSVDLALFSLTNYKHLVLFGIFSCSPPSRRDATACERNC
jgi:hypothetical protein